MLIREISFIWKDCTRSFLSFRQIADRQVFWFGTECTTCVDFFFYYQYTSVVVKCLSLSWFVQQVLLRIIGCVCGCVPVLSLSHRIELCILWMSFCASFSTCLHSHEHCPVFILIMVLFLFCVLSVCFPLKRGQVLCPDVLSRPWPVSKQGRQLQDVFHINVCAVAAL